MPVHPEVEFWLKVVGGIGVLIALTLTWRTHTERATFDMIDRLYTLCHALETHALRDWYLAHLFCVGAKEYESVKEHVKELAAREPQRVPEFIVKEKLFAIHVFISYEQVFYQWKNTSPVLHRRRRRFLRDVLSYFAERLILGNPRLLALLQMDPRGESLHLEQVSAQYLNKQMIAARCETVIDRQGPFEKVSRSITSSNPPVPKQIPRPVAEINELA
jgi:hypothetical protein